MSAARERALARLVEPGALSGRMPAFLAETSRIVAFDWAALVSCEAGSNRPVVRCWALGKDPGTRFAPAGWNGGGAAPALPAGPAPREIEDPVLLAVLKEDGISTALGIPLDAGAGAPASLLLGRRGKAGFRGIEVSAATPLWSALAAAVRRDREARRARRASREQSAELTALLEIVRTAGSALDEEGLFAGLAEALRPAIGLDRMAVLLDEGRRARVTVYAEPDLAEGCASDLAERCLRTYAELTRSGLREVELEVRALETDRFDSGGRVAAVRAAEGAPVTVPAGDEAACGYVPGLLQGRSAPSGLILVRTARGRAGESAARLVSATAGQASLTVDRLREGAEREARRLRALIDSMSDGIVLTDADFSVVMLNPAARSHLEILTGRPDPGALGELGGARLGEVAREVLAGRSPRASTEVRVASRGRIFVLAVTAVTGPRGGTRGLVVVTSDVTRERAMREQMFQTEKLRALGEMISGVAHELNNPLATVMGYAQLLQSASVPEEVASRLDLIASEADRCRNVVRNLLSFARRHRPERKAVSLNEIAESVVALMKYQLRVDGIDLTVELDRSIPAMTGDFHRLQQVLLNLMTNAQQAFSGAGEEGPREVTVRTALTGQGVALEVEDNGPGMSAEQRQRAFEPFFTTKPPGEGTGLGLSIVRETVAEHGGHVDVRSAPGEGTRFRVELPADAGEGAPARSAPPGKIRGRTGSVLVVEDEEPVSGMIRDALTADGHAVETARDMHEGRERIARGRFDVIISDLKMPGGGGRELFERTTSDRPELAGRFIFATGDVVSPDTRRFFDRVRRPVLAKPFDLDDLRRLVRETIERA